MCGRFAQTRDPSAYADYFGAIPLQGPPRPPSYNVAPTDEIYAVATHEGQRRLGSFRWGLIPRYATDRKVATRHINARKETVATKPAFKDSLVRRRCIIPADGFYEWERIEGKGKLPHFIYGSTGQPLALAGLWASWRDPGSGERMVTCTILTGRPDAVVRPIHERMPVMLDAETWDAWLDPDQRDPDDILALLAGSPSTALTEHAVSTLVNDVRNNLPELIEPLRR